MYGVEVAEGVYHLASLLPFEIDENLKVVMAWQSREVYDQKMLYPEITNCLNKLIDSFGFTITGISHWVGISGPSWWHVDGTYNNSTHTLICALSNNHDLGTEFTDSIYPSGEFAMSKLELPISFSGKAWEVYLFRADKCHKAPDNKWKQRVFYRWFLQLGK